MRRAVAKVICVGLFRVIPLIESLGGLCIRASTALVRLTFRVGNWGRQTDLNEVIG